MAKVMDREENGDLEFDFVDCREEDIVRLDKAQELQNVPSADFGVLRPVDPCLIVEVKDPGNPRAKEVNKQRFITEMLTVEFLDKQIVQNEANSRSHMLAVAPDRKHHSFFGVFGIAGFFEERKVAALLKTMQSAVDQLMSATYKTQLTPAVVIVSERSWNQVLPQYPLRRLCEG